MKNIFNEIQPIKLFEGTGEDLFEDLVQHQECRISNYSKGQIIHIEKEDCHVIDIVLEGQISVQKIDKDGNVLMINNFGTKEAIGVNLIFSTRNIYPFHVIATSPSRVLHIDKDTILELCKRNQVFVVNLLEEISDRSLSLTDKISAIAMKTLRQKILDFLALECEKQNNDVIRLSMTKKELSEKLGVQRTSLSRELDKMRKDNLITFNSYEIRMLKKGKNELIYI